MVDLRFLFVPGGDCLSLLTLPFSASLVGRVFIILGDRQHHYGPETSNMGSRITNGAKGVSTSTRKIWDKKMQVGRFRLLVLVAVAWLTSLVRGSNVESQSKEAMESVVLHKNNLFKHCIHFLFIQLMSFITS